MSFTGIVLYGPPASGKSTVTSALHSLDDRFTLFERLRVSTKPKAGYRHIAAADADALVEHGGVIYENVRYGNRYLIDRTEIERLISVGLYPVLHLGQIVGIRAVAESGRWLSVRLQCTRDTTRTRSVGRGDRDVSERLTAWDQTNDDLRKNQTFVFGLTIDSGQLSPDAAAQQVAQEFFRASST